jgi:hypothetical protein
VLEANLESISSSKEDKMRNLVAVAITFPSIGCAFIRIQCSSSTSPGTIPAGATEVDIPSNARSKGSAAFGANPLIVKVGQTHSVVFQSAGTFSYHRSNHPTMTGSVIAQ